MPRSWAALETNVVQVFDNAEPWAANMGRYIIGWQVGSEALGSPMLDQTIMPPFRTILGLAPKNAGSQRTRSAILPGSIDPRTSATPAVIAGLMVTLAT